MDVYLLLAIVLFWLVPLFCDFMNWIFFACLCSYVFVSSIILLYLSGMGVLWFSLCVKSLFYYFLGYSKLLCHWLCLFFSLYFVFDSYWFCDKCVLLDSMASIFGRVSCTLFSLIVFGPCCKIKSISMFCVSFDSFMYNIWLGGLLLFTFIHDFSVLHSGLANLKSVSLKSWFESL